MEPTPTAPLDRNNDRVYDSTTAVVRAVMALSQGVQAHQANQYLDLVKKGNAVVRPHPRHGRQEPAGRDRQHPHQLSQRGPDDNSHTSFPINSLTITCEDEVQCLNIQWLGLSLQLRGLQS